MITESNVLLLARAVSAASSLLSACLAQNIGYMQIIGKKDITPLTSISVLAIISVGPTLGLR